jgi:predicted DNA-binding WGR domain protein
VRRFEFVEGTSSKFWEIALNGDSFIVRYGRIGTTGTEQEKSFPTEAKALTEHDKLIAEKVKKGYSEVDGSASAAPLLTEAPTQSAAEKPKAEPSKASKRVAPSTPTAPTAASPSASEPEATLSAPPAAGKAGSVVSIEDENRVFWSPALERRILRRRGSRGSKVPTYTAADARVRLKKSWESTYQWRRESFTKKEIAEILGEGNAPISPALSAKIAANLDNGANIARSLCSLPELVGAHIELESKGYVNESLEVLRSALADCDDATYQAALAIASSLRNGENTRRSLTTFLFPDAPWAHGDLDPDLDVLASCGCIRSLDDVAFFEQNAYYGGRYSWTKGDVFATLVEALGIDAAHVVANYKLDADASAEVKVSHFSLLAAIGHDAAFQQLIANATTKEASAALQDAAANQPYRALRLLAESITPKSPSTLRTTLGTIIGRTPQLVDEILPSLSDSAQAIVREVVAQVLVVEAPAHLQPSILVSPPWLVKDRPSLPSIANVEERPIEPQMRWLPGEREDWLGRTSFMSGWSPDFNDPLNRRRLGAGVFAIGPDHLAAQHLNGPFELSWYDESSRPMAAARFELDLMPYIRWVAENDTQNLEALLPYGDSAIAGVVADWLVLKKLRAFARQWLLRHVDHAVVGLVPIALSGTGSSRVNAGAALRYLASQGHREAILAATRRWGSEIVSAIEKVLDFNTIFTLPAKMPKLPAYAEAGLARPNLKSGDGALSNEAMTSLVSMCALSQVDEPYAGIAIIKEQCEPASLARFAWDLFSRWLANGAPAKENWCLDAVGLLGDDECARALNPLVRAWPGEAAHQRAVQGLKVLSAIGTDVSLMLLNAISEKSKFKGLKDTAQLMIAGIAESRGLTREELSDRLVPDLGLDENGSMLLSFGDRKFRVGFDEQLQPFVNDLDGARLKALPKPNKTDDEALAADATERWKALKKDAANASKLQLLRVELAMCGQRRWTAEEFMMFFVEHPLVIHITRRLVWGSYVNDVLHSTFRVAEDRSLANELDDVYELPVGDDVRIGVPHALQLSAEHKGVWGDRFADYEILQPFAQLGRETYAPTDAERSAKVILRVKGRVVPTGKVLGLESRGWRRGAPQDGGVVGWMEKSINSKQVAILELDGQGIWTGMVGENPTQDLGAVFVRKPQEWDSKNAQRIGDLEPVIFSELIRDLEALTP